MVNFRFFLFGYDNSYISTPFYSTSYTVKYRFLNLIRSIFVFKNGFVRYPKFPLRLTKIILIRSYSKILI